MPYLKKTYTKCNKDVILQFLKPYYWDASKLYKKCLYIVSRWSRMVDSQVLWVMWLRWLYGKRHIRSDLGTYGTYQADLYWNLTVYCLSNAFQIIIKLPNNTYSKSVLQLYFSQSWSLSGIVLKIEIIFEIGRVTISRKTLDSPWYDPAGSRIELNHWQWPRRVKELLGTLHRVQGFHRSWIWSLEGGLLHKKTWIASFLKVLFLGCSPLWIQSYE